MRSYYSDVQAFVDWCGSRGQAPFPSNVETVCAFIEDQGKEKAASTVRRRLYAIRKVHRLLRQGAAQDLLKKGHNTAAIMRAGGWKSINVLARYLEQAEYNVWT